MSELVLRRYIKEKCLSVSSFAKLCGISEEEINNYLQGTPISTEHARKMEYATNGAIACETSTKCTYIVVDQEQIPLEYLKLDEKKLNKEIAKGNRNIPGLRIEFNENKNNA